MTVARFHRRTFGAHRAPLQLRSAKRTFAHRRIPRICAASGRSAFNAFPKIRDVFGDDCFRSGNLLPTQGERLPRDRLQRIDIVQINALYVVYTWIDITRYCDVDDENRTIDPIT